MSYTHRLKNRSWTVLAERTVVHPSLRRRFPNPPSHSPQRLLRNACCGLPQQHDGSLGGRRHGRALLLFVALCRRQSQRGLLELQFDERQPAEQRESRGSSLRALRPASIRKLFFFSETRYSTGSGRAASRPRRRTTSGPEWQGLRFLPVRPQIQQSTDDANCYIVSCSSQSDERFVPFNE